MIWDRSRFHLARYIELAIALVVLFFALWLNKWTASIANTLGEHAHPSPDLLLSFIPRLDMSFFFVYGFAAWLGLMIVVALWREQHHLAHIAYLYAVLVVVRSAFIALTPMRTPADMIWVGGDPLYELFGRHMTFKNDLFFSSHTAMPFLSYLIYRDRWAQRLFLAFSILMAVTVLCMRAHYSIDVFAAFFITYAVYRWERRFLRAPYRRLRHWLLGWIPRAA